MVHQKEKNITKILLISWEEFVTTRDKPNKNVLKVIFEKALVALRYREQVSFVNTPYRIPKDKSWR